jgi:drug/metabolite transporter (DMT)-like permease
LSDEAVMEIRAGAAARPHASPLVYAGLWLAVAAWGSSFVAARALLSAVAPGQVVLSPTVLAAARFGLASVFFLPPLLRAIVQRGLSWGDLLRMAALGQVTYTVYFWLQYTGVQQTSASVASILVVGLIPLATAFVAQLFGTERLILARLAALLSGFAGVAVIVLQQPVLLSHQPGFLLGALCLIGNAFAFALYSSMSKRWMQTVSPLVMTGGTMLGGAAGLILLSLIDTAHNRWGDVLKLDGAQWAALLFLVLVCSVAAYFAYNFALTRIPAGKAATYIYCEPIVAVLLGVALLHEELTLFTLAGAALIAASVAVVQRVRG